MATKKAAKKATVKKAPWTQRELKIWLDYVDSLPGSKYTKPVRDFFRSFQTKPAKKVAKKTAAKKKVAKR